MLIRFEFDWRRGARYAARAVPLAALVGVLSAGSFALWFRAGALDDETAFVFAQVFAVTLGYGAGRLRPNDARTSDPRAGGGS